MDSTTYSDFNITDTSDWPTGVAIGQENVKYKTVKHDSTNYLILDYSSNTNLDYRYYNASSATSTDNFSSTGVNYVILIGYSSSGAVLDYNTTT